MLLTILLSAASLAPAPAPPTPQAVLRTPSLAAPGAAALCANLTAQHAVYKSDRQARRLGELPPGNLYLTVVRKIDRCLVPTIVKYGDERGR